MKAIIILSLILLFLVGIIVYQSFVVKNNDKVLIPKSEEATAKQIQILEAGIKEACVSGLCETEQVLDAKNKLEVLKNE